MRFLVTSGAGFIGSHITEKLLESGHFVRVLDNFSSGKQSRDFTYISNIVQANILALTKKGIKDVFRTCADISKIKAKLGYKNVVLLIIGLLSVKAASYATEPVTGTEVLRSQELILEEKSLRDKVIDYKVFIKKIIIKGADLLSQDKIKKIILPFEKKWLTKYDIQTIEDLIRQAYNKQGIPEEKLKLSSKVEKNILEITLDTEKTP